MIILALTDIHGRDADIERVAGEMEVADVVILSGDLTNFGHRRDSERVLRTIMQHARSVLAVPGNCDYPDVSAHLDGLEINLHGSHRIVDDIAFIGLGGSLPAPGQTPFEFSEDELAALLEAAAENLPTSLPLVLVAHQPPFDTMSDRLYSGDHVGSTAVRSFIEAHQPILCLTGHIHEAAGITSLGQTRIVNPGPFGRGGYAHATVGKTIEQLEIRSWKK